MRPVRASVSSLMLAFCIAPLLVACGQGSPTEPSTSLDSGSSQASASAFRAPDTTAGERRGVRPFLGDPQPNAKFTGIVKTVDATGFTLTDGTRVIVDGKTEWDMTGDVFSLEELEDALGSKNDFSATGQGIDQGDGTILATSLRIEQVETKG